jgi:gluconolactonase
MNAMNPSLTIYKEEVKEYIRTDFEIQTLADDCQFTEGPVWNPEGYYLFSDITANTVYRLLPGQQKEVYIAKSGTDDPEDPDLKGDQTGSNGLAYDLKGDLLICRHGSHQVGILQDGTVQPFIGSYNGRPFNSPNDLIVHPSGKIFFSDPPYGLRDGKLNPEKFQPIAGVYAWQDGNTELICGRYQYPNGVCLSPSADKLYICSNKPAENFICEYDANDNRFLRLLCNENSDGIKCDPRGNLYLCNKAGVIILNNDGERLALITLPTIPANICWGGEGYKDLFITARENVFLIKGLVV